MDDGPLLGVSTVVVARFLVVMHGLGRYPTAANRIARSSGLVLAKAQVGRAALVSMSPSVFWGIP